MRSLADGRSMTVKQADKGSCVVVYDRNDYIVEGQKQLGNENMILILWDLVDKSNKKFRNLDSQGKIAREEIKYFTCEYQKATHLG